MIVDPTFSYQPKLNLLYLPFNTGKLTGRVTSSILAYIKTTMIAILAYITRKIFVIEEISVLVIN